MNESEFLGLFQEIKGCQYKDLTAEKIYVWWSALLVWQMELHEKFIISEQTYNLEIRTFIDDGSSAAEAERRAKCELSYVVKERYKNYLDLIKDAEKLLLAYTSKK